MPEKCPKCGGTIDYIDVYDCERDDDSMVEYCVGCCSNCETEYQWKEVFETKLIRIEGLHEC